MSIESDLRRITTGGDSIYFPGEKHPTCQKAATLITELKKEMKELKVKLEESNNVRKFGVGSGAQPLSDAGPKPKIKGNK